MNKPCRLVKGGLYISNHGWFAPCYNSYHHIRHSSGLNIKNISIKDYYDSDWLHSYDHNVNVNGSDERCRNCYQEEELGKNSFRLRMEQRCQGSSPARIVQLNLGNLCNNACATCNPYQSSRIAQEWQANNFYQHDQFFDFSKGYDPEQIFASEWWINNPSKFDHVLQEIISLEPNELHLIGGEPTVNPITKDLLKRLLPIAPSLMVSFTTNCRECDPELIDLLRHYQKVVVRISVDGFGQVNEFVRYPGTWQEFITVSQLWIDSGLRLRFNLGLSALTALHFDQLLDYLDTRYDSFDIWHLVDPSFLTCDNLPSGTVQTAVKKLKALHVSDNMRPILDYAINHLQTIETSETSRLRSYVELLCRSRSQDFDQVWSLIVGEH